LTTISFCVERKGFSVFFRDAPLKWWANFHTISNLCIFDKLHPSPKFQEQLRKSCFLKSMSWSFIMRTSYFHSLIFALLSITSVAAIAAPAAKPEAGNAPLVMEISPKAQSEKVDLNQADASTLQRELAGVGEAKAQAIVAYRDINGPFSSVDELLEVKGIGKAILDKNREKLEVN
jgi:competence protein ComEA